MRVMANICPVCGYSLERPAADYRICPSCGTEFGYDDAGRTYAELRAAWLRSGAQWWSRSRPAPAEWDPYKQVNTLFVRQTPIGRGLQGLINPESGNQSTPETFADTRKQSESGMASMIASRAA